MDWFLLPLLKVLHQSTSLWMCTCNVSLKKTVVRRSYLTLFNKKKILGKSTT